MSAEEVLEQLEGLFLAADTDESGALETPELIKVVGQYYRAGIVDFADDSPLLLLIAMPLRWLFADI